MIIPILSKELDERFMMSTKATVGEDGRATIERVRARVGAAGRHEGCSGGGCASGPTCVGDGEEKCHHD